jgi:glycosyltransferase involved in cell wall biosynthesis
MRGGERVLEELLRLYPQADIFTHVADLDNLTEIIKERKITETFISRLPGARQHYQKYLGLMPRALEELDLRGYDLIISSESGPAKGIISPPLARHICYVHSPMRYIWDQYHPYAAELGFVGRKYFSHIAHRLRQWDVTSAARVDRFVANSNFVAQRIERYYRRSADVIHPPVDLDVYSLPARHVVRDYYLYVGQLVRYKRPDLVIDAFRGFGRRLKVVGTGSEKAALTREASSNIEFLGRVDDEKLARLYHGATALIFPAEEDFGIVPVEAMACGTPVLAFGAGGARDSVIEGKTGLFFDFQSVEAIRDAVRRFEHSDADTFDPVYLNAHAQSFGADRFRRKFAAVSEAVMPSSTLRRPIGGRKGDRR